MVRLKLEVHSLQINHKKKEKYTQFCLVANNIPLEVKVPDSDIEKYGLPKVKEAVNDHMLNSLRYIKHVGDLPKNPKPSDLNKWSSTDTGIAIKPKNDKIKEFPRFL